MISIFDRLGYVARQSARVGWYMGHYAAASEFRDKGARPRRQSGPMPSRDEIFSDLVDVFRLDLENAAGVYPLPRDHGGGLVGPSPAAAASLPNPPPVRCGAGVRAMDAKSWNSNK